ncbi:hypothetical protein [Candidatus Sodalis pierantonius]|uniref:hypothetical protein n=1 Tax=Candidatus Sodalis pierantonii TaxID=1486991 RepID=UPI00130EE5B4
MIIAASHLKVRFIQQSLKSPETLLTSAPTEPGIVTESLTLKPSIPSIFNAHIKQININGLAIIGADLNSQFLIFT